MTNSSKKIFVDTNILVYGYDISDKSKHKKAKDILSQLWDSDVLPFISTQVLKEFGSVLLKIGFTKKDVIELLSSYQSWNVIAETVEIHDLAFRLWQAQGLSYWDSFIFASALSAGAKEIWSEDFSEKAVVEDVMIVNPLR